MTVIDLKKKTYLISRTDLMTNDSLANNEIKTKIVTQNFFVEMFKKKNGIFKI